MLIPKINFDFHSNEVEEANRLGKRVAISMIWIMGCHVSVASKTHYAYEKGVLPHPVSVQNTLFICAQFVAFFHVMAFDIHYVHYFYSSTLSFSQFCYSNDERVFSCVFHSFWHRLHLLFSSLNFSIFPSVLFW